MSNPRPIAIAHDWLTGMRGGERVLDALCELYPAADVFTMIHVPGSVSPAIERHRIRAAFTNRLPSPARFYRHYLPLFPIAVESFDLDGYDLVISTSHCAVKSTIVPGRARHLCYCHSPMRYAWDQFDAYFGPERLGRASMLARPILGALARWDAATSDRPHRYLANSQYVADRIRRYYNRRSAVLHPPVDTAFFRPDPSPPDAAYLVVSALVPYKRLEVAIHACRIAARPLRVVGDGPELDRLRREAAHDVEFLGNLPDEGVREQYQRARAVILPGVEDFGIVPVEAQACGRPVVALGIGGARETVVDGRTGVLVDESSPEAFAAGIARLERLEIDASAVRVHAERFSRERFLTSFAAHVNDLMAAPEEQTRW
jgi:glycosyltransferase involved in cell wall biosynthesis